jgi:hypothetical protein
MSRVDGTQPCCGGVSTQVQFSLDCVLTPFLLPHLLPHLLPKPRADINLDMCQTSAVAYVCTGFGFSYDQV